MIKTRSHNSDYSCALMTQPCISLCRHLFSPGILPEWWTCQLVACRHLLKALCPAPCPSHTPSRPLSHTLLTPRPLDKTQSSHQRATESSIRTTNCSHIHINTHTHTHACLCCLDGNRGQSDEFPSWQVVIRQVHRVSDWQFEVPITIDSQLSGNWFPAASSHSKEEEEDDKEDNEEEWMAVRRKTDVLSERL